MNTNDAEYLVDGKYGIRNLVDLDELRRMFERFTEATGFTIGFLDHPAMNVLIATGWRDLCTKFHRGCPLSADICTRSNRHLLDQLDQPGKLIVEPCANGLVDCAFPIIVKGKHIASLATGQLLLAQPDLERFKRQARLYGFDEQAYLLALEEIPVVAEEKLRSVTTFLGEMALVLSRLGYAHLTAREESERLEREIAARKQAEAAELEGIKRFQLLFESSRDAIMTIEPPAWRFTSCNLATLQMFGAKDKPDFTSFTPWELSPERQRDGRLSADKAREMIGAVVRDGSNFFEWTYRRIGGEDFQADVLLTRIEAKGKVIVQANVRDITLRKADEESLRRAHAALATTAQRARAILDEAGCLFNITDRDALLRHIVEFARRELGVERCGIFLLDEKADKLVGTFGTDDLGRTTDERAFRMDKDVDLLVNLQERVKSGLPGWIVCLGDDLHYKDRRHTIPGKGWIVATPISMAGGSLLGVMFNDNAMTSSPLDESLQDQLAVFCSLFGYLLERRKAETEKEKVDAQLRQAQKMEAVGRLAGGVAHDFNNMLGIILGRTEMVLERMGASHQFRDDLEEIRQAAQHSADLTRKLLAFSRKQTIAPKVLNVNETVAGMLKMLQRLIGEHIALVWRPGADLWLVKVDPSQLDQVLANLCVNARDAVSGVGRMTIATENRTFTADYCAMHGECQPGDYVLLAVSDDGCGMDAETQAHLFEPFFSTKATGQGTGLGLATVYGIVTQNNGCINVYSEPGKGTTFKIYLPRHVGEAEAAQPEDEDGPVRRGHETILLVEDAPALLKMIVMMLQMLGYTVLAASTPAEAIQLAREHSGEIDLLMTDVVMPEMNGRDLARHLLCLYPQLKRLFTSGYTANVIAHHGVLDEGVHFIQKPFRMQELAAKVRAVLDAR